MSQTRDPITGLYVNPLADEGQKRCGRCKQAKLLEDFPVCRRNKDGRGSRCKPCAVAATKEWREAHPDIRQYRRQHESLARYGLTQGDFDAMLAAQGGGCALCQRSGTRIVVDHDHVTGRVRGLLCVSCNAAVGKLGDTATALQRVVEYLT